MEINIEDFLEIRKTFIRIDNSLYSLRAQITDKMENLQLDLNILDKLIDMQLVKEELKDGN